MTVVEDSRALEFDLFRPSYTRNVIDAQRSLGSNHVTLINMGDTSKKIPDFFNGGATTTDATGKRQRSCSTSGDSPTLKRVMSDDALLHAGNDVTVLIGFIRKAVQRMDAVAQKLEEVSLTFTEKLTASEEKFEAFKAETDESIRNLTVSVDDITAKYEQQVKINGELLQRISALEDADHANDASHDQMEQYSRRNCLLVHGIGEAANEDTTKLVLDTFSRNLEFPVKIEDIDRTHRLGRAHQDGTARPIIVKFARYMVRADVYRAKRKLKGTGTVITESLTRKRVTILKNAQEKYGKFKVWTQDGEIFREGNNKGDKIKCVIS